MKVRSFLGAIGAGFLFGAVALLIFGKAVVPPSSRSIIASLGPTLTQLENLEQLIVKRIYLSDILVGQDDGYRGAWLIRGDALIAIDFSKARIERDDKAFKATIWLPSPHVLTARVDHERTKTWDVKRYSWIPWRGDQDQLRDEVMQQAQRLVEHGAASAEYMEDAKSHAALVVEKFFALLGWTVIVQWESADHTPRTENSINGRN